MESYEIVCIIFVPNKLKKKNFNSKLYFLITAALTVVQLQIKGLQCEHTFISISIVTVHSEGLVWVKYYR